MVTMMKAWMRAALVGHALKEKAMAEWGDCCWSFVVFFFPRIEVVFDPQETSKRGAGETGKGRDRRVVLLFDEPTDGGVKEVHCWAAC